MSAIRVTVWNEYVHERDNSVVAEIYPDGIHATVAKFLQDRMGDRVAVRTATLDEPEHGLTQEVLDHTDVLTWWGHAAHDQVEDDIVSRVQQRVLQGMGLLVMHSGHASKIFQRLLGTSCMLRWREAAERERIWVVDPGHPIAAGIDNEFIELDKTEMYGEFFDIPQPDELIFVSWFEGGEVFRSGCTFRRGKGKIFYFRPGHETFPIYHHDAVQQVIANGVEWLAPSGCRYYGDGRNIVPSLSPIAAEHEVDDSIHKS